MEHTSSKWVKMRHGEVPVIFDYLWFVTFHCDQEGKRGPYLSSTHLRHILYHSTTHISFLKLFLCTNSNSWSSLSRCSPPNLLLNNDQSHYRICTSSWYNLPWSVSENEISYTSDAYVEKLQLPSEPWKSSIFRSVTCTMDLFRINNVTIKPWKHKFHLWYLLKDRVEYKKTKPFLNGANRQSYDGRWIWGDHSVPHGKCNNERF